MIDTFRYVSCHENNFETYSIILEGLLIETCSFFDSLCQTLIREKSLGGYGFSHECSVNDFKRKVDGKEFNFGDYRSLLQDDLELDTRKVKLNLYEDVLYSHSQRHLRTKLRAI